MPPEPKRKKIAIAPQIDPVQQEVRSQTSGILRLPLELFLEIFSYLTDHRRFIRENYYGRAVYAYLWRIQAARAIAIRGFTMTCWPLRNLLLPLLWTDIEGCIPHIYYNPDTGEGGEGSHLHAQCIYLCLNPEVATYVRTFSVNLHLQYSPPDLMNKFIDSLVRLPNLKTLEILDIDPGDAIPRALKRELATFTLPSVRELRILPECHHLVENCPNLESLIFTRPADERAHSTVLSHGQGLRCIAGMSLYRERDLNMIVPACPNLQEIGIFGSIGCDRARLQILRQLKRLTVVDINLDRTTRAHSSYQEKRTAWRRELISILADSPSTGRKVLKWKVVNTRPHCCLNGRRHIVLEDEELEVPRETSL